MNLCFDLIVVIPVGPSTYLPFVLDTMASVHHYISVSHKIIVIDDSQKGMGNQILTFYPETDVLIMKKNKGTFAGLYISLSHAYTYALAHYSFTALLKMDTDALIIGQDPQADALKLFNEEPQTGIAGQYPNDYHGRSWNIRWPRRRILNAVYTWKFLRNPFANSVLLKWHSRARKHHYVSGESVFGGCYFFNPSCLKDLQKEGLLPKNIFRYLKLGEDHIFSLLVKAIGFSLGSLSEGNGPFGCAWKGLPVHPKELINDGKKIIHSTRFCYDMDEEQIRSFFQNERKRNAVRTANTNSIV